MIVTARKFQNAIWHFRRMICNKIVLNLEKNVTETYGILQTAFRPSCMNRASVLWGIRNSRKAGSLWRMMRGVGGVRKLRQLSWLAKGLGLGLPCWGFLSLPKVQTLLPETFGYSLSSEAVVMRQLRRWKRLWRRSLTRSHKSTSCNNIGAKLY